MSPRSPPYAAAAQSNLTTSVYETPVGSFSVTWSRSLFSRSLLLQLHSGAAYLLHLNPLAFWKKSGSRTLAPSLRLFWDLSRARFGPSPEPLSGFYLALLLRGRIILLLGDLPHQAYARTHAALSPPNPQSLVLKRVQLFAPRVFSTTAPIAGALRHIRIDCGHHDHTRLSFCVDDVEVLQVRHLRWKFRGNDKIHVDGVPVHISWDVFNWVFPNDTHHAHAHAFFMFRFDQHGNDASFPKSGVQELWSRRSCSSSSSSAGSSSSVLDLATVEESELGGGPSAFSLLVYACKK